jgi:SPP1 gp7 family putative phage head morphogenesis protein
MLADAEGDHKRIVGAILGRVKGATSWDELTRASARLIPDDLVESLGKIYARHIGRAAVSGAEDIRQTAIDTARAHSPRLQRALSRITAKFAAPIKIGDVTIDPVPFGEAADIWAEAGYYASAITRYRMGEAMREAIAKAITDGEDFRDFRARLEASLGKDGLDAVKPEYLQTVYRTNLSNAYSAGRTAQLNEPGMREMFPAVEYVTARDGRVRPDHAALDGIVLAADDGWWLSHTPPLDWGCRCSRIARNKYDVESGKVVVSTASPYVQTGKGFGSQDYPASLKKIAADLGAI